MSNITTETSVDSSSPPPTVRHAREPCAVCEHLQRRCRQDCPFALHFPGERPTCLDSLCLAYGPQNAARMLEELNREQWIPEANSLVYDELLRLQDREKETLEVISRLQYLVFNLQVSNWTMRNQIAVSNWIARDQVAPRQRPQQRPLSIYDLVEWPTNDGQAGVNEPPGDQTGGPPAYGPREGSLPPGGHEHGAPSSSKEDNRHPIGPP